MRFTSKELDLLRFLSTKETPVPAIELAEELGVSSKSVYRMIKQINSRTDVDIVNSYSGKGFLVNYEEYLKLRIVKDNYRDTERRQMEILLRLLYLSPKSVTISYLFDEYYLSDTMISKDIQRLNSILKASGLLLSRKAGRLSIQGEETTIRHLIDEINHNLGLYSIFLDRDSHNGSFEIDFVTNLFEKMETQIGAYLTYPYRINIFSHLYILFQRGKLGYINQNGVEQEFTSEERELIAKYPNLYRVSKETINAIRSYLNIPISSFENFYLFFHLISSRFEEEEYLGIDNEEEIYELSKLMVEKIGQELGLTTIDSKALSNFTSHIRALVYRLKNQFIVKNELLGSIKSEWRDVFKVVKSVGTEIFHSIGYDNVSDDEFGFLTLYFVNYLEESESVRRILIMCSSGVGTSELLKTRVIKNIPNIEVVEVLSVHSYKQRRYEFSNIDLVITTVNFKDFGPTPSILVSVLFNEQDVLNVQKALGRI